MSAAEDIKLDIEDLISAVDKRWRKKIHLRDLDESKLLARSGDAMIGIANDADPTLLLDLALNSGLKHVCQFSNLHLERELNTSASMLVNPAGFLNHPIATILIPTQARGKIEKSLKEFEVKFSKASEKYQMLARLDQYLRKYIRAGSLIDEIKSVADELFTNAVYNAPYSNNETDDLNGIDRTDSSMEMPNGHQGVIFAGTLNQQIVVGCQDPFGSLKIEKLLNRILKCYQDGVASTMRIDGSGGAGIGSFMVYNTAASYYVGVQPGHSTTVCCSLPINMSGKKRGQIPKNIHIFEIKGGVNESIQS